MGKVKPGAPRVRHGVRPFRTRPSNLANGCIKYRSAVTANILNLRNGSVEFWKGQKRTSLMTSTSCANSATRKTGIANNKGLQIKPDRAIRIREINNRYHSGIEIASATCGPGS